MADSSIASDAAIFVINDVGDTQRISIDWINAHVPLNEREYNMSHVHAHAHVNVRNMSMHMCMTCACACACTCHMSCACACMSPQRALWRTAKELKMDDYHNVNMFDLVLRSSVDTKEHVIYDTLWAYKIKLALLQSMISGSEAVGQKLRGSTSKIDVCAYTLT